MLYVLKIKYRNTELRTVATPRYRFKSNTDYGIAYVLLSTATDRPTATQTK